MGWSLGERARKNSIGKGSNVDGRAGVEEEEKWIAGERSREQRNDCFGSIIAIHRLNGKRRSWNDMKQKQKGILLPSQEH